MTSQELLIRLLLFGSILFNLLFAICLVDANKIINWFFRRYATEPRVIKMPMRNYLHRLVLFILNFPVFKKAITK
jgi:hypothetical protein